MGLGFRRKLDFAINVFKLNASRRVFQEVRD